MTQQINSSNVMDIEAVQDVLNVVHSIDFGTVIVSFIVFFLLGYLLYATMFAAIGSIVENNTDSQQFTLPVTVPLIVAIISAISIVNNPDGSLAVWLSMIPFTSPVVMMVRIPFGIPIWQVVVSAVILAGTFVGMTWVAAKIYRTGILMYGKKLTYKEIFKCRNLFAWRNIEEFTSFVSLIPFEPGIFSVVEAFERSSDYLEGFRFFANGYYHTGFNLEGRDVNYFTVHGDVAVANELASGCTCRCDTEAVNDVVQTALKELDKDFTGNTFLA